MRFSNRLWFLGLLVLLSASLYQPGIAQDSMTCPSLVEKALTEIADNCAALDHNSACYGFNRVNATFAQAQSDTFFSEPADRAGIRELTSITTAPLALDLSQWGVALLNIQANLPGTLPGQGVVFILLGDTQVTNDVPVDEALNVAAEPIEVTAPQNARLRSAPSANANVIAGINAGTTLLADGLSEDRNWLRVSLDDAPAWVSREVVVASDDVDLLPVIGSEQYAPMQAFSFTTGIGTPQCQETPDALLIQGPEQAVVNLTVNGADIRLGSTIVLTTPDENTARLQVIDGLVRLNGDVAAIGGTLAEAALNGETGEIASSWGGLRPMTEEELAALQPLENIPSAVLHYPIDVPTYGEVQQELRQILAPRPQPTPAPDADSTAEAGLEATPESTAESTAEATGEATAAVLPGDQSGGDSEDSDDQPPPSGPTFVEFGASPARIREGECAEVYWTTGAIASVRFQGEPTVAPGSKRVCPVKTTTYVLTIRFQDNSTADYFVTVEVANAVPTEEPTEPRATTIPRCGNNICEPGEGAQHSCPRDCPEEEVPR